MRRLVRATLVAAILCFVPAVPALAQRFPSKAVHIVVPLSAGGSVDALARAFAVGLSTLWSQPVVIENVAGAGTIIGTLKVASAPPDGHTLLFTIDSTVVGNRFLYKKLPYDPDKSLVPITMAVVNSSIVFVNPSLPVSSFRELVEMARRTPGQIAYSSVGRGAGQHLFFETIAKREGVQFIHVPYKGVAPLIAAVVSGEVQVSGAGAASVGTMLKAGKVKALAIAGERRSRLYPDVPTLAESGYAYATMAFWYGLFAPGGTNAQLVERIYRDVTATIRRPEFTEKYISPLNFDLIANTPAEFAAAIRADMAITAEMVKAADLKPE